MDKFVIMYIWIGILVLCYFYFKIVDKRKQNKGGVKDETNN